MFQGKSIFVKGNKDNKMEESSLPLTQCGQMRAIDSDCEEQIMGIHPGQKGIYQYMFKTCTRKDSTYR